MNKIVKRAYIVYFIFLFLIIIAVLRAFYIQVVKQDFFVNLATRQYLRKVNIKGDRGLIFDRRKRDLAINISAHSLYADPYLIKDPYQVAEKLSPILGMKKEIIVKKLTQNRRFVWIKRKLNFLQKQQISSLKIRGLGFIRENRRFYPNDSIAAHILGGVDIDNQGLEGVELFYDRYLRGKDGMISIFQDASSRELVTSSQIISPSKGCNISLTIDLQIQYWVEKYLKETVEKFNAVAGSVIVMHPYNGEIIALANIPSYDPNNISRYPQDYLRNRAITDIFEPGSVFKIVTMVAALDKGVFTEDDVFYCENGRYKIPGSILHDYKPFGKLTFKDVFKKSSNIGVAKIASTLGKDVLYEYIRKLGFLAPTGVDLPGEEKGMLRDPNSWSKTDLYIVPIGQSVSVTAMQLALAFSIIANGGYVIRPHIVKEISCNGDILSNDKSFGKRRVLREDIAMRVKDILAEVVKEGTGRLAYLDNVEVCGKTGTAQKVDPSTGRYGRGKYRASFVGFFPKDKPRFLMVVSIDEPKRIYFGGVVAAPLFKKIAEKIWEYDRSRLLK